MNAPANAADVRILVAGLEFGARVEAAAAPFTCSDFRKLLPLNKKMIHCRWSGEGVWIPMDQGQSSWRQENATSHLQPRQILLYAGGPSEPELLIPYGQCIFNSKFGMLLGNHFLTIVSNLDSLAGLGRRLLWEGAKDCAIELRH